MTTALASAPPKINVDYVNPVITATRSVFEMMLGCTPQRTGLTLGRESTHDLEVSGVIGITGVVSGTLVVSFSQATAIEILKRMVGTETTEINSDVCDAVGELTNMIAGGAKAQLAHLKLSISIPNLVTGRDHMVHYPSNVKPMCIHFESDLGPFTIEVGFNS